MVEFCFSMRIVPDSSILIKIVSDWGILLYYYIILGIFIDRVNKSTSVCFPGFIPVSLSCSVVGLEGFCAETIPSTCKVLSYSKPLIFILNKHTNLRKKQKCSLCLFITSSVSSECCDWIYCSILKLYLGPNTPVDEIVSFMSENLSSYRQWALLQVYILICLYSLMDRI